MPIRVDVHVHIKCVFIIVFITFSPIHTCTKYMDIYVGYTSVLDPYMYDIHVHVHFGLQKISDPK